MFRIARERLLSFLTDNNIPINLNSKLYGGAGAHFLDDMAEEAEAYMIATGRFKLLQ